MTKNEKTYEGMFLLPPGMAEFEKTVEPVRNMLERIEAQTLTLQPWDERRLAYTVNGFKRGLYVLTYFKADPARIGELEHDCQLNEGILRVLILRRDNLGEEQINAATPATTRAANQKAREEAAEAAEASKAAEAAEKTDSDTQEPAPADTDSQPVEQPQATPPDADSSAPSAAEAAPEKIEPLEDSPQPADSEGESVKQTPQSPAADNDEEPAEAQRDDQA